MPTLTTFVDDPTLDFPNRTLAPGLRPRRRFAPLAVNTSFKTSEGPVCWLLLSHCYCSHTKMTAICFLNAEKNN